tara:strand:- start:2105 stop:2788 length:684 start_codon:yes stop_codon:yes gene_type:complete
MSHKVVGHNFKGFDLPYMLRSTIFNGAKGKSYLVPQRGKFWADVFFDTMDFYSAGVFGDRISLDAFAKAIGSDGKNGNGKFFYQLPREEQESYLENDLIQTKSVFNAINNAFEICDNFTIIDIETGPKSDAEIMALAPEFKPENVKVGNLKDPVKIEEKIEAARESHYDDIIAKAGLDPRYSNPIAVGYLHFNGSIELDFGEPVKVIERFWEVCGNIWGHWLAEKNL